jgi:hypothetical protein
MKTMRVIAVLVVASVMCACATTRQEILTERGTVVFEAGKLTDVEVFSAEKRQQVSTIMKGHDLYVGDQGLDGAGGPRVKNASILNADGMLVDKNGGASVGTLQGVLEQVAPAAVFGTAAVVSTSIASSAAKHVANTEAHATVQQAEILGASSVEAAKNLRPAVTNITTTSNADQTQGMSQDQSQAQDQHQGQDQTSQLDAKAYGGTGGNASATGGAGGQGGNVLNKNDVAVKANGGSAANNNDIDVKANGGNATSVAKPMTIVHNDPKTIVNTDVDVSNKADVVQVAPPPPAKKKGHQWDLH